MCTSVGVVSSDTAKRCVKNREIRIMSYITCLGLTLTWTFDARLQCLYAEKQPDVDGKCYWLFPSYILACSPVF